MGILGLLLQGDANNWGFTSRLVMLMIGIGVLAWVMLRQARGKILRRQQDSRLSASEKISQLKKVQLVHEGVETLMAELADLSRQVNGQLDTRIARLDILLAEADCKIKLMQELSGKPTLQDEQGVLVDDAFDAGENNCVCRELDDTVNPIHREVKELAEGGLTACAIAQKLGRPVGEVELILSLLRKKR